MQAIQSRLDSWSASLFPKSLQRLTFNQHVFFSSVLINERASGKRHEHMLASGLQLPLYTGEVADIVHKEKRGTMM